jgi:hypothetical protein
MKLVNIVSQIPSSVWERELPQGLPWSFTHSNTAVDAEIHVIYGLRQPLRVPNSWENTFFVASEPPDIRAYNTSILSRYRAVLGPSYEYLLGNSNFSPVTAVTPWWAGMKAGGEEHYGSVDDRVALRREDFEKGFAPERDVITAIVSQKAKTTLQQQRLRLVDYLSTHLSQFEVYGLATERVDDKADVLGTSRYHLAIENSSHPGYWTEKLADPILMDNVTFYGGHSTAWDYFKGESVVGIDPWNPEETYRTISEALNDRTWEASREARTANRRALLDTYSFHRVLSSFLSTKSGEPSRGKRISIPAQHPKSRLKKFTDPIYRRLFS